MYLYINWFALRKSEKLINWLKEYILKVWKTNFSIDWRAVLGKSEKNDLLIKECHLESLKILFEELYLKSKNVFSRLKIRLVFLIDWLKTIISSLKNWLEELYLKHNKELIDWRARPRKPGFWWYIL